MYNCYDTKVKYKYELQNLLNRKSRSENQLFEYKKIKFVMDLSISILLL
jgi:hypothetical protein